MPVEAIVAVWIDSRGRLQTVTEPLETAEEALRTLAAAVAALAAEVAALRTVCDEVRERLG